MPLSTFVKQQNTEFDPHMALYLRHFRLQRFAIAPGLFVCLFVCLLVVCLFVCLLLVCVCVCVFGSWGRGGGGWRAGRRWMAMRARRSL